MRIFITFFSAPAMIFDLLGGVMRSSVANDRPLNETIAGKSQEFSSGI